VLGKQEHYGALSAPYKRESIRFHVTPIVHANYSSLHVVLLPGRFQAMSLLRILRRIDGKGYKAYRELEDVCERVAGYKLCVVRVQGDPFAPPSVVRIEGRLEAPKWALGAPVAVADLIYRRLYRALRRFSTRMGEGRSGLLSLPKPAPIMIRRSGLEVYRDGRFVARVWVGLPSRRRRVLGDVAEELLLERLPRALREAVDGIDESTLRKHVQAWIEQEYIRSRLPKLGLVAFVGDGSILPRRCGGCYEPLPDAIPFESPSSMRVEIELPTGRTVTGMGVPRGLTLIAGSAFHGKTTLAEAILQGVYNHVPGDGRELVVSLEDTVQIRAEDGRWISCVDISPMIHSLPGNHDTTCFTTTDASGATSVAAAIQEAIELGAKLLVVDEDNTATNILYLDPNAKNLTKRHTVTPITELVENIKQYTSIILVSTGATSLLATADKTIVMEDYKPYDRTEEARKLAPMKPPQKPYKPPKPRTLERLPRLHKPRIRGGRLEDKRLPTPVDLTQNPHLQEEAQLNTLLAALHAIARILEREGPQPIRAIAEKLAQATKKGDWRLLTGGREPGPDMAEVRKYEIAYMLNRLPRTEIKQEQYVQ